MWQWTPQATHYATDSGGRVLKLSLQRKTTHHAAITEKCWVGVLLAQQGFTYRAADRED
jgi:hypothetical protein